MRFLKKKPHHRAQRGRYRFVMTVITSNYELEDDDEREVDPVITLFEDDFANEQAARKRAMHIFKEKTASGITPAEFQLYRIDQPGQLITIGLLTPAIERNPFGCSWGQPRVDVIRGAA